MKPQLVHLSGPPGRDMDDFVAELLAGLRGQGLAVGLLRVGPAGPSLELAAPRDEADPRAVLQGMRNLDLVISLLPAPKGQAMVEFQPSGAEAAPEERPGLLAMVGPGQAEELSQRLAARATRPSDKKQVIVLADGRPLPAKTFVHDILLNSILGLIGPLKGVEEADRLEIIIE